MHDIPKIGRKGLYPDRKLGHKAVDCRSRVDIRLLNNKGLMAYMQSELVQEEKAEKADSPKEDF